MTVSGSRIDFQRIDEAVLALMHLTLHDQRDGVARSWKGFDWDALSRLHSAGWIASPAGKARSVVLTDAGLRRSQELFQALFVAEDEGETPEAKEADQTQPIGPTIDAPRSVGGRTDPLIAELAADYSLSERTFQCLLKIPARFPDIPIPARDVAATLRTSHIAPLSTVELLALPNFSHECCRELAVAIERLGWSAHVHAEHPLRPDAVGVTAAWRSYFDTMVRQRREVDRRALDMLEMKDEGLTNEEVGRQVGVSASRVGQLLKRARDIREKRRGGSAERG